MKLLFILTLLTAIYLSNHPEISSPLMGVIGETAIESFEWIEWNTRGESDCMTITIPVDATDEIIDAFALEYGGTH